MKEEIIIGVENTLDFFVEVFLGDEYRDLDISEALWLLVADFLGACLFRLVKEWLCIVRRRKEFQMSASGLAQLLYKGEVQS